jgi:hypothetical protein
MKIKSLIVASMTFFVATTFAQEGPKSKKGETVLPEKGDWAIGVDASPFLVYVGNIFNKNNTAAPTWQGYTGNLSLVGKMFKDDKTAYRAVLSVIKGNDYRSAEVTKAMAMPNPDLNFGDKRPLVKDTWSSSTTGLVVGGGIEKRKGKGRLQGFYGGEALISLQAKTTNKYTYGNALTQNPTGDQPDVNPGDATYSTNFNGNLASGTDILTQNAAVTSARILNSKQNGSFGLGVRGFIGAEYFFMPKMSIGGEFGWGLAYQRLGKSSVEWEAEGKLADGSEATAKVTENGQARSLFNINQQSITNNAIMNYIQPSGLLKLNFHF